MKSRHAAAILLFLGACSPAPAPEVPNDVLFPAAQGVSVGFINRAGKMVIRPQFDDALPFFDGLAPVRKEGKWGYIDLTGKVVIPFYFRSAHHFHDGEAVVDSGLPEKPWGVIDRTGAWVIQPGFMSLERGRGPNALYLGRQGHNDGFAYYDRSGTLVCGPYSLTFGFSDGYARADTSIIDSACNVMNTTPVIFEGIQFSEGLIAFRRDKKVGYMNGHAETVIQPTYEQGGAFSEGVAPVQLNDRWLFIDQTGQTVAEFSSDIKYLYPLSGGVAMVTATSNRPGKKLGYVDRKGFWVVKAQWDDAEPFQGGLARVADWQHQITGYIDPQGTLVWKQRLIDQGEFGQTVILW